MLIFKLEEYKDGKYIYSFFPDLDYDSPGKIAIYDNGQREVLEDSAIDIKRYYAGHALWGIKPGKAEGTVAWC